FPGASAQTTASQKGWPTAGMEAAGDEGRASRPHTRTIRAAAVGRDRQFSCMRIALSSLAFEPATDRMHGELGSIARDPDADEAGVGGHIVYAIRHDLAEFLVLEALPVPTPRIAFRTVMGSDIL